jgi:hypothetical protein
LTGGKWLCSGFGRPEILSRVLTGLALADRENTDATHYSQPKTTIYYILDTEMTGALINLIVLTVVRVPTIQKLNPESSWKEISLKQRASQSLLPTKIASFKYVLLA